MTAQDAGGEERGGSILIVDDLANWQEVLTDVLAADGHRVYTASGPSQAMELLARLPVDVAILDLRLQDRDTYNVRGVELLESIRAISPRTSIIMMTGFPSNGLEQYIEHAGVDGFWLKNSIGQEFDIETFGEEIRALVRKARLNG